MRQLTLTKLLSIYAEDIEAYLTTFERMIRPVARVFEEGVLKLSAHKRGKFFGMTTPIFL